MRAAFVPWVPAGLLLAFLGLTPLLVGGAILQVGPGEPYRTPCAAIRAAHPGDIIEVSAAGRYDGDVCVIRTSNLTLRGVGGRPKIDAAGQNASGKGTWVIATGTNNITVDNFEFTGAKVPDHNGAGIRAQGGGLLTIRHCYFHDNEDGILQGGAPDAEVLIEYSEFARNGYGDGQSHNLYIGHAHRFTLRFCYSHDARSGHLVKSRAAENYILYNRLSTEANGTSSYELELPNGGLSYVIGNILYQGPRGENGCLFAYQREGPSSKNPSDHLYVVNNTFVNTRHAAQFILVGSHVSTPVVLRNNLFTGTGTVINQAAAIRDHNLVGDGRFVDATHYDFHLLADSPAINAGADPATGDGYSLTPQYEYRHPASREPRRIIGAIDIGAYEYAPGPRRKVTPSAAPRRGLRRPGPPGRAR